MRVVLVKAKGTCAETVKYMRSVSRTGIKLKWDETSRFNNYVNWYSLREAREVVGHRVFLMLWNGTDNDFIMNKLADPENRIVTSYPVEREQVDLMYKNANFSEFIIKLFYRKRNVPEAFKTIRKSLETRYNIKYSDFI